MTVKATTEVWTAKICWTIIGPVPITVRKAHGKRLHYQDFPPRVRKFLQMDLNQAPTIGMTWPELESLQAGAHGVLRVNQVSNTTIYLTFEITPGAEPCP